MKLKKITLFVLLIFNCWFASASTCSVTIQENVIISTDSLQIDDSNIQPRNFDNLKDKYLEDDFVYERNKENVGWWTRFKQWLSDLFKSWFDLKNSKEASNMTDLMLKIGGILIFLLVVFFIFKAVMNNEGQWVFGKSSDKNIIPVTDIESNLTITDFNKLTKNAESKEEFRLAIRYYYLWLLKKLSTAEIIEYDVDKTNSDYYNEIQNETQKEQFSYTSYLYNYIWYGEFDVDNQDYDKAKNAFVKFLNSIKA